MLSFSTALAQTSLSSSSNSSSAEESLAEARKVYSEQGPRAGLPKFEQALKLFREKSDRHGEAIALGQIGNCYERLADYPRALEFLGRALAMKHELGDRLEEGKTLSNLGLVFWDMGDYSKAIDHFTRGLQIARETGDKRLEGTALNNLGLVYDEQGDYRHSLENYNRALESQRAAKFAQGETDTLGNIGGVYLLLGRYRQAHDYYQQALTIDERLKLNPSVSLDLGNLALCQLGLGQPEEAIRTFDRGLAIARAASLKKDEADWHKGKGSALLRLGKYDLAREEYRLALDSYEQAGLKRELIEALTDDGTLHIQLGDIASGEKDFRRAIELARSIGHPRGVTANLITLGDLEWRRQRFDQAVALYQQAFERARDADDQGSMASSLLLMGFALRDQGRIEEATSKARQALEIGRETGAALVQAQAFYALAELARKGGESQKALEHYAAGEDIAKAAADTELIWKLEYGKGQTLESLSRDDEALATYRRAVEVIEGVRNQLQEERFRAGYIEDKFQVYVALVRLLLKIGKTSQAFQFAEKLRARSYLDLLNHNEAVSSDTAEAQLRSRIRQLQRAIDQENVKPKSQQRGEAIGVFTGELAEAEHEYQALIDDLRSKRPELAGLLALTVPTTEEVQAVVPAGSAVVEYVMGNDSLAIFVVTGNDVLAKTISIRAADVRAKTELLRDLIVRQGTRDWNKPAESLYRLLIQPLEQAGWLKDIQSLYLVPHEVLNYLPFAVLRQRNEDGGRFIIENYRLAYLPAASALVYRADAIREPQPKLLAFAPARSHLRYAAPEAQKASTFFSQRLVLLNRHATETAFKHQAENFEIIHLATHGFFDRLNPMFSGVQLEQDAENDGRLEVHEILRMHLKAQLVTLSACETALGSGYFSDYPAGDDFVGLTRAFLFAGSSGVLATLWEVNDRSSLSFMRSFYRNLQQNGDVGALQKAQLLMLRSGGRYRQPYFWAPFVLAGGAK
jgi:CHAT domain-containing protein/Tfp pilus assembly protein PilF